MQIEWLDEAVTDLQELYQYIADDSQQAAEKVLKRIYRAIDILAEQPYIGRVGRVYGTRELVVPHTPYIVPYRIKNDILEILEILRVIHGAMQWPDHF